jgi:hypothetical protein
MFPFNFSFILPDPIEIDESNPTTEHEHELLLNNIAVKNELIEVIQSGHDFLAN